MSPLVKFLLPLVVVLPLGGFVAGSLVSAAHDDPGPRTPIVLREDSSRTPTTGTPTDEPTDPSRPPDDDGDDDVDDDADDQVVTPKPVDDDGDAGDDADDGAEDDDDDGEGGDGGDGGDD